MRQTDCDFLLDVLADGREHTLTDILTRSILERGHGLTTHSRVAELRRRGHNIQHVTIPGARRGEGHAYRLVSPATPEATTFPSASGVASDGALSLFEEPVSLRGAYDEDEAA